ncbi:CMD domain-containing protein [Falsirhodobacter sp. 20TX0035]|uniref:CMD domain-containing protein n=1 Tax=Falsirhodobacter sp. 20TX0035 TaxID=3022019 RepID=UPI00232D0442|nr:esterase [Falsirhodobacter sp. 20TX0035]MDB6453026.1 esterase [Falsirhodobacter sp. 20TX0035]
MTDAIDQAAGLDGTDPRHALRRRRPEFVEGAEACRASVLHPADDLGLSAGLRNALAHRMALLNKDDTIAAQYVVMEDFSAVASGATDLPEPLNTIARHVDMVTADPTSATAEHIRRLEAAGLSAPQIVALSELIAYVNFQVRVVAGLRLLGAA